MHCIKWTPVFCLQGKMYSNCSPDPEQFTPNASLLSPFNLEKSATLKE